MLKHLLLPTLLLSAHPALAATFYQVTPFTSSSDNFQILSANANGELAGYLYTSNSTTPVISQNGTYTILPTLPTPGNIYPETIDNAGDIGIIHIIAPLSNVITGYIYSAGQYSQLTVPEGNFVPILIANNGTAAGTVYAPDSRSPVNLNYALYNHGQATFLPGGATPTYVNDRGDFLISSPTAPFVYHADGSTTALPALSNAIYDQISSTGVVAGHIQPSSDTSGSPPSTPGFFMIRNGQTTFLPTLQPDSTFVPTAINAAGTIAIARYGVTDTRGTAFIYQDGQLSNLDDLVTDHSYHFVSPLSLSDDGTLYLLAQTPDDRSLALQLTPIPLPEPTSLLLLLLPLSLLTLRRPSCA